MKSPQDSLGRPLRDLRISVTDRCNLRCSYCMPAEIFGTSYKFLPKPEILTYEEIERIARSAVSRCLLKLRITGGEPLLQRGILAALLRECKTREIHTVVDTSGFAAWDVIDDLRGDVDLFLYDLKLIDDSRHTKFTGVSNQLILTNLRRLAQSGAQVVVRIPLIPGINDDAPNLGDSATFIASLLDISEVELMAYHDIASAKYESLGMTYPLPDTLPPSDAAMQKAARFFEDKGLTVKFS